MFCLAFGVNITVLSSIFHSKIPDLISVLGPLLINISSVACPYMKYLSSDARLLTLQACRLFQMAVDASKVI